MTVQSSPSDMVVSLHDPKRLDSDQVSWCLLEPVTLRWCVIRTMNQICDLMTFFKPWYDRYDWLVLTITISCTLQSELQYLQSFVCTDIYTLHTELQDLLYPAYRFVCVDSCILHTNWSARSVFCSFVCTDSFTVAARSAVTCRVLCAQIVALCVQTELQNLLYSAQSFVCADSRTLHTNWAAKSTVLCTNSCTLHPNRAARFVAPYASFVCVCVCSL